MNIAWKILIITKHNFLHTFANFYFLVCFKVNFWKIMPVCLDIAIQISTVSHWLFKSLTCESFDKSRWTQLNLNLKSIKANSKKKKKHNYNGILFS